MLSSVLHLVTALAELTAAFLFLYGLKRMSSPVTAPGGIFVAGLGMLVAILATFLYAFDARADASVNLPLNLALAVGALLVGGGVAWWSGKKVAMTAMPQMVALYNGAGGGAAGAIAAVELLGGKTAEPTVLAVTLAGGMIGAISLAGSIVAWAKLDGILHQPLRMAGQQVLNGVVLVATVASGVYLGLALARTVDPILPVHTLIALFFGAALLFGVLMTLPIGGADMPVVISIYNAFTGLAVGLEGFVLQNPALMVGGMVVGAAGLLLTLLMARAMNRSVANVLFTRFGATAPQEAGIQKGSLKPVDAGDAGIFMRYASSVIIVPGYGLAVAQGQQKLYEL